jgi:TPR repeat protein
MQNYFNCNLYDFEFIKTQLEHLLKDRKDDIPDRNAADLYAIYKTIHSRKRIDIDDPFGEKNSKIAHHLADYIPKASVADLKRRAKKQDVEAILQLADCYMFRFKKVEKNVIKASEWYTKAHSLGSPEAMMSMVYSAFSHILDIRGEQLANHTSIFSNHKTADEAQLFHIMLAELNAAARCDYISPLLLKLASEYQEEKIKSSFWLLPENVKVVLAKIKADEAARARDFDFRCSNLSCAGRRDCGLFVIVCDHCNFVRFVYIYIYEHF